MQTETLVGRGHLARAADLLAPLHMREAPYFVDGRPTDAAGELMVESPFRFLDVAKELEEALAGLPDGDPTRADLEEAEALLTVLGMALCQETDPEPHAKAYRVLRRHLDSTEAVGG